MFCEKSIERKIFLTIELYFYKLHFPFTISKRNTLIKNLLYIYVQNFFIANCFLGYNNKHIKNYNLRL